MHGGINYQQQMAGMPGGASNFSTAQAMAGVRAMYPPQSGSPGHAQQQYMQQQQAATTAAQQQGMQGWAPPGQGQPQGGGGWQGYPSSSGH